jgi:hypothetical protein
VASLKQLKDLQPGWYGLFVPTHRHKELQEARERWQKSQEKKLREEAKAKFRDNCPLGCASCPWCSMKRDDDITGANKPVNWYVEG